MAHETSWQDKGLEGRLFVYEGQLCLVLSVEGDRGRARISRGKGRAAEVLEWSMEDLRCRFHGGSNLILDGLNSPKISSRITQEDDGWYFQTREGRQGPLPGADDAHKALQSYILASQSGLNVAEDKTASELKEARSNGAERRRGYQATA